MKKCQRILPAVQLRAQLRSRLSATYFGRMSLQTVCDFENSTQGAKEEMKKEVAGDDEEDDKVSLPLMLRR